MYKIANTYNVTIDEIIELNNLGTTILSINQQLLIPNKSTDTVTTYTVQSGDTLYKIANTYNVTVDDIITSNNLTSTTLSIGQILTIPTGNSNNNNTNNNNSSNNTTNQNYISYIVQSGDSLYKIAKEYQTTVTDIKNLNNLTSNFLSIGQVLKIPTTNEYITYTVQSGDTLYKIANEYNTTVDIIKSLNNLTNNILSIGQSLIIPK